MPMWGWSRAGAATRAQGNAAEDLALAHLRAHGLALVARNYRPAGRASGEIDLVMRECDGTLVFVEVRARSGMAHGGAAASVGAAKRRRIVAAAGHYLLALPAPPPCRFDVVAVDGGQITWLQAAFDAG